MFLWFLSNVLGPEKIFYFLKDKVCEEAQRDTQSSPGREGLEFSHLKVKVVSASQLIVVIWTFFSGAGGVAKSSKDYCVWKRWPQWLNHIISASLAQLGPLVPYSVCDRAHVFHPTPPINQR